MKKEERQKRIVSRISAHIATITPVVRELASKKRNKMIDIWTAMIIVTTAVGLEALKNEPIETRA